MTMDNTNMTMDKTTFANVRPASEVYGKTILATCKLKVGEFPVFIKDEFSSIEITDLAQYNTEYTITKLTLSQQLTDNLGESVSEHQHTVDIVYDNGRQASIPLTLDAYVVLGLR
jgi:hypothetical protein